MDHQITLDVPDEVYQALLKDAEATGRTVESAASACLIQLVRSDSPGNRLRRWAGAFASDVPDAGLRHDEYLGQVLMDELRDTPDA
jgi:hypothetical protein